MCSTNFLSSILTGRCLREIRVGESGRYVKRPPAGFSEFVTDTEGLTPIITQVSCKGKFMWWRIAVGKTEWSLWITYGMSGQWTLEKTKHSAFEIVFSPKSEKLFFNDPRHFGTLKFVKGPEALSKKLASLGPDMLSNLPTAQEFTERLDRRADKTVVEALMDQSVVSGVGNYVKCESLFFAEISPHRVVDTLTARERERLRQQIMAVMQASYATNGATFSTYQNPDGSKGNASSRFVVYGNKTDPIGNPVIREETKDGRTTHWVKEIQK